MKSAFLLSVLIAVVVAHAENQDQVVPDKAENHEIKAKEQENDQQAVSTTLPNAGKSSSILTESVEEFEKSLKDFKEKSIQKKKESKLNKTPKTTATAEIQNATTLTAPKDETKPNDQQSSRINENKKLVDSTGNATKLAGQFIVLIASMILALANAF